METLFREQTAQIQKMFEQQGGPKISLSLQEVFQRVQNGTPSDSYQKMRPPLGREGEWGFPGLLADAFAYIERHDIPVTNVVMTEDYYEKFRELVDQTSEGKKVIWGARVLLQGGPSSCMVSGSCPEGGLVVAYLEDLLLYGPDSREPSV
jgi:hypothetical protein